MEDLMARIDAPQAMEVFSKIVSRSAVRCISDDVDNEYKYIQILIGLTITKPKRMKGSLWD